MFQTFFVFPNCFSFCIIVRPVSYVRLYFLTFLTFQNDYNYIVCQVYLAYLTSMPSMPCMPNILGCQVCQLYLAHLAGMPSILGTLAKHAKYAKSMPSILGILGKNTCQLLSWHVAWDANFANKNDAFLRPNDAKLAPLKALALVFSYCQARTPHDGLRVPHSRNALRALQVRQSQTPSCKPRILNLSTPCNILRAPRSYTPVLNVTSLLGKNDRPPTHPTPK